MKNFDVRIVSKDIINGESLATCIVTHNKQYFATVRYNYFNNSCEILNRINAADMQLLFGVKSLDEYSMSTESMFDEVYEAIIYDIRFT